jgi:heat shock protein HspQ
MARSRPPKDSPWYHVLVHQGTYSTYVAEHNLEADSAVTPVIHPAMDQIFSAFEDGAYVLRRRGN